MRFDFDAIPDLDPHHPDTLLDELDLDSLALLEIFYLLDEAAGHEIPDELVPSLRTIGDIADMLGQLEAGNPG